ncbi:MAG: precorrin-2 dehydrogenase/sirohydrochlorin ferrochelatase, partial [Ulvibacter sp.]
MSYFPLFLGLKGKSVLIIGAGKIALSKLQIISEFTKDVHILSDNFSDLLLKFSSENGVELIQSKYHKLSLKKYDIIIGATNDRIVNNQ